MDEEQVITAQGVAQTPQQMANAWLRGVANEREEV